jgi:hypothetical protein
MGDQRGGGSAGRWRVRQARFEPRRGQRACCCCYSTEKEIYQTPVRAQSTHNHSRSTRTLMVVMGFFVATASTSFT